MPFSPGSPGFSAAEKVYLFSCPFKEKDEAKKRGAKWDVQAGSWYVPGGQNLEPFNKWHPNDRKYLVCSYDEKDDAKKAGAKWDPSCRQWYFDANDSKAESKLARWLPSTPKKAALKSKTKKKLADNTNKKAPTAFNNAKPKALTKSQLATIPRINNDMTIAQLHAECRARDPSIKGLASKNKNWLLDHLKIGTPWISADASSQNEMKKIEDPAPAKKTTAAKKQVSKDPKKKNPSPKINEDMTVAQLQKECRFREPDIKGLSNKNKTWLLKHLKRGTIWKSSPKINADMTVAQLQTECRIRDPDIKGLSTKNKSWFLDHLKIGTHWNSWKEWDDGKIVSAPAKPKSLDETKQAAKKIKKKTEEPKPSKVSSNSPVQKIKPPKVTSNSSVPKRTIKKDPDARHAAATQPSKKKQKTAATTKSEPNSVSQYTKITKKMSLAKLQEEAKARQLDQTNLPKLKPDLLNRLVEGSICVHESPEYGVYQNLLRRVEREEFALLQAREEDRWAAEARLRQSLAEQERQEYFESYQRPEVEEYDGIGQSIFRGIYPDRNDESDY